MLTSQMWDVRGREREDSAVWGTSSWTNGECHLPRGSGGGREAGDASELGRRPDGDPERSAGRSSPELRGRAGGDSRWASLALSDI